MKKLISTIAASALVLSPIGCAPERELPTIPPEKSVFMIDTAHAKGGGGRGGGFSSGGSRSSGAKGAGRGSGTGGTSKSQPAKPSKPKATVVKDGKKPSQKGFAKSGKRIDGNYKPRFRNGYNPPEGTVIYQRSSALDWLPFWYIATHNGQKSESVAVEPDGKEVKVQEEGKDGMYIVNWILTILLAIGLLAGVVWLVNKFTNRKEDGYATV